MVDRRDEIAAHNNSLTLVELIEAGGSLVHECARCKRTRTLDLNALIAEHGGETRVAYVNRHARCLHCDAHTPNAVQ